MCGRRDMSGQSPCARTYGPEKVLLYYWAEKHQIEITLCICTMYL